MNKTLLWLACVLINLTACNSIDEDILEISSMDVRSVVNSRIVIDSIADGISPKALIVEQIIGPIHTTRTVYSPTMYSPHTTGLVQIKAVVSYHYYTVRTVNGPAYNCLASIDNVTTSIVNSSPLYLLWQDHGSRAFATSSNIDPIVMPQKYIYVTFDGTIVGQAGFFDDEVDANEEILTTVGFQIPQ